MVRKRKPSGPIKVLPDFRSGVVRQNETKQIRRERGEGARRSKRFATGVATIAIIAVSVWAAFATRVSNIEVVVNTDQVQFVPVEAADITRSVKQYLSESFVNPWFINESRLINKITSDNQAVASVEIASRSGKEIVLDVSARKRAVIWEKDGAFYEVDTLGIAFNQLSEGPSPEAVIVKDQTGLPITVGESVASPRMLEQIIELRTFDTDNDAYQITNFIAPEAARELHFNIAGKPYVVKTILDMQAVVVDASLTDSITFFSGNNTNPASSVDLRVEGRATYR